MSTLQVLQNAEPVVESTSPYEPKNLAEVERLAKIYAESGLTKVRSASQATLIMATGDELGIKPTAALRAIYVADFGQGSQATLSADLMKALCLRDRRCAYFRLIESTDEIATYETKRGDDPPVRISFSMRDRERAKLGLAREGKDPSSSNWAKYPAVMLRHRAASLLAREVYPDLILGFYTEDEAAEAALADAGQRFAGLEIDEVKPLPPAAPPPPAVQPGPAPLQLAPEEPLEQRAARWEAALRAATDEAAAKAVTAEITRVIPKSSDPTRKRLAALYAERKAASWAPPVEPPHDPVTGEVHEREPGQEG